MVRDTHDSSGMAARRKR